MVKPLTLNELAAALGVSRSRVSQMKAGGMPLSLDGARAWRESNIKSRDGARVAAEAPETFRAVRLRVETARAEALERQNRQALGELCSRFDVRQMGIACGHMLRDTLLQRLDVLAELLAGQSLSAHELRVQFRQAAGEALNAAADLAQAQAAFFQRGNTDEQENPPV